MAWLVGCFFCMLVGWLVRSFHGRLVGRIVVAFVCFLRLWSERLVSLLFSLLLLFVCLLNVVTEKKTLGTWAVGAGARVWLRYFVILHNLKLRNHGRSNGMKGFLCECPQKNLQSSSCLTKLAIQSCLHTHTIRIPENGKRRDCKGNMEGLGARL